MPGRLLLACALLAASTGALLAHAIVLSSTPRKNATVRGAETPIEIRFSSLIDAKRSRLTLNGPDGSSRILAIEEAAADTLKSHASGLVAGAYTLHWQTLARDGHITQGAIPFSASR